MPPPLSSVSEGKLAERERVALYPRLEAELEEVFADPADVDEPVKALPLDCRGPTVDIAARQAVGRRPPVEQHAQRSPAPGRSQDEEDPPRLEAQIEARPPGGLGGYRGDPPAPAIRESVRGELRRAAAVVVGARVDRPVGEPLGAIRSEVALGSRDPARGALGAHADRAPQPAGARLAQERADGALGDSVVALSEMHVPHPPEVVDQVLRGPVLVAEGVP